jgi:hypothetical protein
MNGYNNTTNVWGGSVNRGINLGSKVPTGTYFFILEVNGITKGITGYIVVN